MPKEQYNALSEILSDSKLNTITDNSNLIFYDKVKSLLIKDGQSTSINENAHSNVMFYEPLQGVQCLRENQEEFIRAISVNWLFGVLDPFLTSMNTITTPSFMNLGVDNRISMRFDGDVANPTLALCPISVDRYIKNIKSSKKLTPTIIQKQIDYANQWSNTLSVVENADMLINGMSYIKQLANKKRVV